MLEALVVLTIAAMAMIIALPSLADVIRRARHGAAVRHVLYDVREARARAVSTGWEYRLVGYDAEETGERKNQYRVLARRSAAVAWPDEEAAPFASATQLASRWTDIAAEYPDIDFDSANPRFELTFDSRGTAPGGPAFSPLRVLGPGELETSLNVSVVGGARLE